MNDERLRQFDALYAEHARALLAAATLAAGGSPPDGWDGVQHAFEQAWLRLRDGSAPPVRDWGAWLRKTAVRHVLRRARGRQSLCEPLENVDPYDASPPVADHVVIKEKYQQVLNALASLPERQRQALALREIADFSTAETARIMDISDGAVRSLISQARQSLLETIGQEGVDG
ncbi:RNA polymerase sigma factor [Streptomyces sp. NPDC019890]|uniref:RNA polymerase sigma factor n=1 Tax=Streptomyces sp. NPDC019890 TaxID=3365064 RepID=UPI00384FA38F